MFGEDHLRRLFNEYVLSHRRTSASERRQYAAAPLRRGGATGGTYRRRDSMPRAAGRLIEALLSASRLSGIRTHSLGDRRTAATLFAPLGCRRTSVGRLRPASQGSSPRQTPAPPASIHLSPRPLFCQSALWYRTVVRNRETRHNVRVATHETKTSWHACRC